MFLSFRGDDNTIKCHRRILWRCHLMKATIQGFTPKTMMSEDPTLLHDHKRSKLKLSKLFKFFFKTTYLKCRPKRGPNERNMDAQND